MASCSNIDDDDDEDDGSKPYTYTPEDLLQIINPLRGPVIFPSHAYDEVYPNLFVGAE